MITLFKQNRIRKYYYLVFLPLYLTLGLLRVLKLLPKKYILFGAGGGSQFIDNSKYSYLLNKNQNNCIWITHSFQVARELKNVGYRAYLSFSIHGIYFQIFSKLAIVSHGTFDLIPILLLKVSVLQYWHGCPIKKIGVDVENKKEKSVGDKIWGVIYKVCPHLNNYYADYFVDNSKNFNYQSSFEFGKPNYIKIPYPRLFPLYSNIKDELEIPNEQLIELRSFVSDGKKIIVYMPTYRDNPIRHRVFEEQLMNLATVFGEDDRFVFVYKAHFILTNRMRNDKSMLFQYLNPDPYPLLELSSGLITDYSSIVFDYLPTNKPLSLFIFDKDMYQNNPGYYYDIEKLFASILAYDYKDVYENIKNEIFNEKVINTEKGSIFNDLFYNTFYKQGPFDIQSIKYLLKSSNA